MIQVRKFGTLPGGTRVQAWELKDDIAATVLSYGARLGALNVRIGGRTRNVVLGFGDMAGYVADRSYQGAVAGRYANRIADARFSLDGHSYRVSQNDGTNCLHGGVVGFDHAVWECERDGDTVVMQLVSKDGDQGFPGRMTARVCYAVLGDALRIDYHATTDAPTVVNLTNHAYFNLAADGGSVLDHVVSIAADRYTPIDGKLIPTGELRPVAGTPFDFRTAKAIGARIDDDDVQLHLAHGYDHNFVLADQPSVTPNLAASVTAGGLVMQVLTTQPGIQFYTGNFLKGAPFPHRGALCLETQHFPDSPNQPTFPSTTLRPGEVFSSTTLYRFNPG